MKTGRDESSPTPGNGARRLRDRLRRLSPERRWRLRTAAVVAASVALLLLLRGYYQRELYHLTGAAQWMWATDEVSEPHPSAGLFIRTLWLNDRPQEAVAKVCGDRQYVLWINGQPAMAGRNRPEFHLDVVPVTDLLTAGANTIVVEARSSTSVGAVLFALDLTPSVQGRRAGDPRGRNVVVSGPDWRVTTTWRPGVLDGRVDDGRAPWIWGRPPDHPWAYPTPVLHERPLVQAVVGEPQRVRPGALSRAGRGRWVHRLRRGFGGLLWVDLGPGNARPEAVGLASDESGAPMVPVVALPGQERWLYPGWVSGDRLVVEGAPPLPVVELVEAMDTRTR